MVISAIMVRPELQWVIFSIFFHAFFANCKNSTSWKTLHGDAPVVVARGGFSGLFPDSSYASYEFVNSNSSPDTVLWCDVQLTKNNVGICYPYLTLENSSTIEYVYSPRKNTYFVNGVHVTGWFPVDFTSDELSAVSLMRGILSRSEIFDALRLPIQTVHNVTASFKHVWLNIQHGTFYAQHNLSMMSLAHSLVGAVDYISSPELQFVRETAKKLSTNKTQLVFRFLGQNELEPTTNQTYGSLLKNLTAIKKFASGILVPKEYIWPVDPSGYLLPHTSVVSDAHNAGLKVFSSGFANDNVISYNYSYDPVEEYLSFIDNGNFSVDGMLSDYPISASAAIDCYSNINKNDDASLQEKPLIISFEGSSGDYPGCTNLAYERAISDGANVIDCPVQMTWDGIPICLGSINLINSTTVLQSSFRNSITYVPELGGLGIYTFDLTWTDLQMLKPQISNPYSKYDLFRNPKAKNLGQFLTLDEFLVLYGTATSLSGILISIENAAFLETKGLDVTDAVIKSLSIAAGLHNKIPTAKKVMIQSSSSAVLKLFKQKTTNYKLVYNINEVVQDVHYNSTIQNIKSFADAVVLEKGSVYPSYAKYLTTGESTKMIQKLHAFGLSVYVKLFENEFVSQAWDFMSDARIEINAFVNSANADGIVTSFPKTVAAYKRNKCVGINNNNDTAVPVYMQAVKAGELIKSVDGSSVSSYLGPMPAPLPFLTDDDVNEPPLRSRTEDDDDDDIPVVAETVESKSGRSKWDLVLIILLSTFAFTFLIFEIWIWRMCRCSR